MVPPFFPLQAAGTLSINAGSRRLLINCLQTHSKTRSSGFLTDLHPPSALCRLCPDYYFFSLLFEYDVILLQEFMDLQPENEIF